MRLWTVYLCVLLFCAVVFTSMMNYVSSPEETILGEWEEIIWEYEMGHKKGNTESLENAVSNDVKKQLGKHLVIHSSEKWEFFKDGRLKLIGDNFERIVFWNLKGRGHVLEIKYDDGITEHYNITKLNKNTLVLNFESEIQTRGLAKLTFGKTQADVKEI